MSQNNQKFVAFVQAVGADIKNLNENKVNKDELTEKYNQLNEAVQALQRKESGVTEQVVTQKISELKNELLGGEGLDETLDTLKELGEKLKELKEDDSISAAITQKLTELNDKIEAHSVSDDLVQVYTAAKL